MKIFLYDKYLATMGGGEKHAGGIAEVLSSRHDVTILHNGTVDVQLLSRKLNLNLSNVHFVSFGDKDNIDNDIVAYVNQHKPDVFINATYYSGLVSKGTKNVALIFFPKTDLLQEPTFYDKLKHRAGNLLFTEYTQTVQFHEGFWNEELIDYTVGQWSDKKATLFITKPFKKATVYYKNPNHKIIRDVVERVTIHGYKRNFTIATDRIAFRNISRQACGVHFRFHTHKAKEQDGYTTDTRDMGLFVTYVDTDALSPLSRLLVWLWRSKLFKKPISKLYVKWTVLNAYYRYKYFLDHNLNLANSQYTYQWIRRIYGKAVRVEMLYPPVDVSHFRSAETKENTIISVGRFFVGGHNKKQLELIKAFKRMYDSYPEARTYTLHICGGTHTEKPHQEYLRLCRLSAQGYPILIHANIPFQELVALYAKAKIFWHAAGMHENEQLHPDKFEHFGITTVEAMAAGCVPVVIGVAGQKEIVKHGTDGLLWQTEKELIDHTVSLMNNEATCKELAANAIVAATKFSRETFNERVRYLFEKVI